MARQNRVRIYHELATARKNGVAQVHVRRSLSSCAAQDAIEPKAKPEMAAVAWVSRKPVNPRVGLFGGCRLDTPRVATGLIFLVFSFFEPVAEVLSLPPGVPHERPRFGRKKTIRQDNRTPKA